MRKDKIEKELVKVSEQIEIYQAKKRELEQQRQEAEDAETMRVIRKHKITADQLLILNKLSEAELEDFLEQKKKEKENLLHEKEISTQI